MSNTSLIKYSKVLSVFLLGKIIKGLNTYPDADTVTHPVI